MIPEEMEPRELKMTEFGNIPIEWKVVDLEEISSLMTNGFVGTATPYYTDSENGIKYLYGKNVRKNYIDEKGIRWITKEFHNRNQKSQLREGDLLTVQSGHIGTSCVVSKYLEGSNCHALIITRLDHQIDPYFVSFYLNSDFGIDYLSLLFVGSTIKHINVKDFKKFKIILPPLPEQKKIASILSSVDEAIQATQKVIDQTELVKQGLLQELLTKGIGYKEFKMTEIGEIPVEWEVGRIRDVCDKITDGEHLSPVFIPTGKPILSAKDITDGFINLSNVRYISPESFEISRKRCNPEFNDVLIISRGATIGKSVINNVERSFALMGSVILLKPNTNKITGSYLYAFTCSNYFQSIVDIFSGSSAQPAIYLKDIEKAKFPVPPLHEQNKIASILSSVDDSIQKSKDKKGQLISVKKGLMQDLLTGKVRVI